jgi:hypothetical protein
MLRHNAEETSLPEISQHIREHRMQTTRLPNNAFGVSTLAIYFPTIFWKKF